MKQKAIIEVSVTVILLLIMGCTGCANPPTGIESSLNESSFSGFQSQTQSETSTEISKEIKEMFSNREGWDFNPESIRADVEYRLPEYQIAANNYNFSLDEIINRDQFTGFTPGQEEMLEQNGFVVLKPALNSPLKMHHFYEKALYYKIPIFITSDAILHMYHLFYSESLRLLEISEYLPEIEKITQNMLNKALLLYEYGPDNIKAEMEIITAYFGVASQLLEIPVTLPSSVKTLADKETVKIAATKERIQSEIFNQPVDYTQFKPRGHYTMAEEFERYFRTMMWYGLSGFQVSTFNEMGEEVIDEAALKQSLLITCLILAGGSEDIASWIKIYDMTSLYSGTSDDLNVLDFAEAVSEVYGEAPSLEMITDRSKMADLTDEVKKCAYLKLCLKFLKRQNRVNHSDLWDRDIPWTQIFSRHLWNR